MPEPIVDEPIQQRDIHDRLIAVTDLLGRKWSLVIMYELLERGPLGFAALKDEVDALSGKVLAQTLEDLVTSELIDRRIVNDRPVRVEYSVTERGRQLRPVITTISRDFDWVTDDRELRSQER